jgi:hypothetical protein
MKIGASLYAGLKKAEWERLRKVLCYWDPLQPQLKEWAYLGSADLIELYEKYSRQSRAAREMDLDLALKRDLQDKYLSAYYLYRHSADFGAPGALSLKALRLNSVFFIGLPGSYLFGTDPAIRMPLKPLEVLVAGNLGADVTCLVPEKEFNGGYLPNSSIFSAKAEGEVEQAARALVRAAKPYDMDALPLMEKP